MGGLKVSPSRNSSVRTLWLVWLAKTRGTTRSVSGAAAARNTSARSASCR